MGEKPDSRRNLGASSTWPSVTAYIGEAEGRPVSISFFGTGMAVNFDYLRDHRHPEALARLGDLVRDIPGTQEYLKELERKDFRHRPPMKPSDVLSTGEQLEAWKRALRMAVGQEGGPSLSQG
jgi:hypothetical protein